MSNPGRISVPKIMSLNLLSEQGSSREESLNEIDGNDDSDHLIMSSRKKQRQSKCALSSVSRNKEEYLKNAGQ